MALRCLLFCSAFTTAFVTPTVPHRGPVLPRVPVRTSSLRAVATSPPSPNLDATPDFAEEEPTSSLLQVMHIRGGRALSPSHVTLLGAVANVLLSLLKLVVGTLSGSASLVADAYHSASDLLVDAVTMLAVNAPPAFERLGTLTIAGLLTSAGVTMVWSACLALWRRAPPTTVMGTPPLLVALVAIASMQLVERAVRPARAPRPPPWTIRRPRPLPTHPKARLPQLRGSPRPVLARPTLAW